MERKPALIGTLASVSLLVLYGLIMTTLSGFQAALEQFKALLWLMVPLALGFGIQVGLYTTIRAAVRQKTQSVIATSGTSAGVGMLACCAHHATDILPIIGLSGISLFLLRYQIPILGISLGVNLVGILIMLKHIV